MKLVDLLRHLRAHGCRPLRDVGKHAVWVNPANNRRTTVPRHREIPNPTAAAICKQLDVPPPP